MFLKPRSHKLVRWESKQAKRRKKAREKRLQDERDRFTWNLVRVAVYTRDGGRCRVSGRKLYLSSRNPFEVAHVHHIQYRSANGSDDMENLILLSPEVHDQEHRHLIRIEGTASDLRVTRVRH